MRLYKYRLEISSNQASTNPELQRSETKWELGQKIRVYAFTTESSTQPSTYSLQRIHQRSHPPAISFTRRSHPPAISFTRYAITQCIITSLQRYTQAVPHGGLQCSLYSSTQMKSQQIISSTARSSNKYCVSSTDHSFTHETEV